ncbi:hypothetical protein NicSoilB4_06040 [Arthrobacter sp. NicSoilB4]|uniref:flagellar hook-length control protein FliK n=1 Tax=Arthrobacter sp. NicSoilB4 TaxID=2830997 RepID=UPI001CC7EFDD|nr:flagellar hook-length control protein FliK [Arthrobacter sp. NicSoilB4]BCW65841.1 hypothetical protein NicSoilB4_06040 [Arthrobacter sp. NicSoilB4]
MKGMDLASALAAPVQGRGSGQGARSRTEAGNDDTKSFDAVFNDVHGVADAAHRQPDDAGGGTSGDSAAQGSEYGSAAVQNPALASGDDGTAFAGSAAHASGHVAGGPADQQAALTLAAALPVQDDQAPSAVPVTAAPATGADPRLAVPGALSAATVQTAALQSAALQTAAFQTAAPETAQAAITSVPGAGLGTGVPPAAPPAAGEVPGANSTAAAFTMQAPAAEQTLNVGVPSGSAGTGPLTAPATGAQSSAAVLRNAQAPDPAPATAGAPSSTAPLSTVTDAGSAAGFPAAAPAVGATSRPARTGTTPAAAPATAAVDALAATGTAAAAAAPAAQPTSSPAAAPQPAAPPAPQPGATLQPQLAKPLFTLAGAPQGQHIMTLQVTPEDLGPMTVRAHIDAAGVRIELFAPGDAGREAIRGILPELRKELADAGFGASLDVSEHSGPGNAARDGTSQGSAGQDGAGRDSGSGTGNRNSPGDPRPGHRWEALADGAALRDARILNGPQTTLDILV